jgi:tape measure domain-containing protein
MAGGSIGYATLPVIPSIRGVGQSLSTQIVAPAAAAGTQAGRSAGANIVAGIGKTVVRVGAVVGGAVATVGAALGGVAITKGLDRLLNIEDAQAKLRGLGHDATAVSGIMGSALDSVRGTAFGLGDAATVAANAVAAGIQPGADLTRYLKLTADAAVIAGTSMGEMGSIINKVQTSGKVYTDNLNQLADRGIPIFKWLQEEYGVSADGLSEMVRKGEVDAATFNKVIEENIGGAALEAGNTTRGALANTGAALGRLGAQFLSGGVAGAPGVFQSLSGAVDRAAVALTPYSDALNTKVVAGMAALAGWIDRIDFGVVVGGAQGLYDLVVKGDFTGAFGRAFNVSEDSGAVDFLLTVRDGIIQVFNAVRTGDLSGLGSGFSTIITVARPMAPILVDVAEGLGQSAGAVGDLIGAGIPVVIGVLQSFTGILGFLGENTQILTPLIIALAAGFILFKSAETVANAASVAALPIKAAAVVANIALANSNRALATQQAIANGQVVASRAAFLPATAQVILNTGALIASRVAMVAGAVATGVATAAQWAWNAAMTANPIGIIIVAIAALVAGIIWVATQTTFFQDAWAAVTAGIATAATWLWTTVLQPVFSWISTGLTALGGFFVGLYTTYVQPVFAWISAAFSWIYNNVIVPIIIGIALNIAIWGAIFTWLWGTIVQPIFDMVGAKFNWLYTNIVLPVVAGITLGIQALGAFFSWLYTAVVLPVFAAIGVAIQVAGAVFSWLYTNVVLPVGNFISAAIRLVGAAFTWWWQTIVQPALAGIGAAFSAVYSAAIAPIGAAIQAAIRAVGAVFTWLQNNVVSPVSSFVRSAFSAIGSTVSGIANGIRSSLESAGNAVGSVFVGIADKVSSAFSGLVGLVKVPINGVIRLANSAISSLNGISATIPDWVPGVGGSTFGLSIPRIPMLARGANVAPRAGGTMAILAEAGRSETVTDLGNTNALIAAALELAERATNGEGAGGSRMDLRGSTFGYTLEEILRMLRELQQQAAMLENLEITETL